ncbi:hypothetical protein [Halorubrum aidingense]|uniref:hypothetical protein n=1 Tax=Halorubrum aidingense TaxID=368623 RepID=UPI001266F7F1|nr:hypothetical protein [Halorubrum aidingense]
MREHYEAFGSVCAAAIANGDSIIHSVNEIENNGEISITIQNGVDYVVIAAPTSTEYLSVVVERRHQNLDQFDEAGLPHIEDAEEVARDFDDFFNFDGRASLLTYESGQVELFDGVAVHEPIYPYEDGFSLKEYRTVVNDVVNRSRNIFDHLRNELDIEMDGDSTAADERPERLGSFH